MAWQMYLIRMDVSRRAEHRNDYAFYSFFFFFTITKTTSDAVGIVLNEMVQRPSAQSAHELTPSVIFVVIHL